MKLSLVFLSILFSFSISGIRKHLGWFTLFIFALEGVFGMAPAIYMDGRYLNNKTISNLITDYTNQKIDERYHFYFEIVSSDGKSCNATQSTDFSAEAFVGAHVTLQVIFPYLVPFVFFLYPLISLGNNLHVIEDAIYKSSAKTAIIVATSYAITYTPLALMQLVVYPVFLR